MEVNEKMHYCFEPGVAFQSNVIAMGLKSKISSLRQYICSDRKSAGYICIYVCISCIEMQHTRCLSCLFPWGGCMSYIVMLHKEGGILIG